MVWLLDGNSLVTLAIRSHVHHSRALAWFYVQPRRFSTCAVTEGTLQRLYMMSAPDTSAASAWATLSQLHQMQSHEFWPEGYSYGDVSHHRLTGQRQITHAWLAELASLHEHLTRRHLPLPQRAGSLRDHGARYTAIQTK